MQFVWLALVPVAVFVSYFYRIFNRIFNPRTSHAPESSFKTSDSVDLWGTYRSNLLFGMRTKTPQALLTGLAWNSIDTIQGFTKMRHACDLDDEISFGWNEHNGRSYGYETIEDKFHNTRLSISFLKIASPLFPSRESWTAKFKTKPLNNYSGPKELSLIFYLAYDGDNSMKLKPFQTSEFQGYSGWTAEVGNFVIGLLKKGKSEVNLNIFHEKIQPTQVWEAMESVSMKMRQKLQEGYYALGNQLFESDLSEYAIIDSSDPESRLEDSNMIAFQFIKSNNDKEDFELFYFPIDPKLDSEMQVNGHLMAMSLEVKQSKREEFDAKVKKVFHLNPSDDNKSQLQLVSFVKYVLSNLLGGISYFYGDSQVFTKDGTIELTAESSLFTDVPARANFPRGFYWDSGFHNILIGKWDWRLSLEILSNWIDKIDENGWIGREQILGAESRSKVPSEYITQNPNYSNPPAPLLPIEMLANLINSEAISAEEGQEIMTNLRQMYPKLVKHFNWFLKTQRGAILMNSSSEEIVFRWRGRSNHHTLTSGLDDYPRGNTPSDYELHVDLLSWMAFASRSLQNLKRILEISTSEPNEPDFTKFYEESLKNLNEHHWDESRGCYSDVTVVNETSGSTMFVPNVGYVSIFPMLFGLVPVEDSDKLERLFDILEDPEQLWTSYGIRSLSKSDAFYNEGDKYWTGPIWINLNYLILSSLKKYYKKSPRACRIYEKLRMNLIENMHREWKRTGFIWEQYNDETGLGQRSRPFTGWSSLIVLIISENYH